MAFLPLAFTVMMAKPAFQRLLPGAEEFAEAILQECAAVFGEFLVGVIALIAFKSRGEDPEALIWGYFKHHPWTKAGFNGLPGLLHRPPAGALAIGYTNLATARLRGRVLLF